MEIFDRITRIHYSLYQLLPLQKLGSHASANPRKGCLLKVTFKNGTTGFSDCFPWPELGDAVLEEQLHKLTKKKLTPNTERSLEFAEIDAQFRNQNCNLFQGEETPPSHYLCTDLKQLTPDLIQELSQMGFSTLKIKVGSCIEKETQNLQLLYSALKESNILIRLDFNSNLKEPELCSYLDKMGRCIERVDFLEDPIQYDPTAFHRIQRRFGIRLALDRLPFSITSQTTKDQFRFLDFSSFQVWVIKPAIQDWRVLLRLTENISMKYVVTSYLDHPLGQITAAWSAIQIQKELSKRGQTLSICGLTSQSVYEKTPFSECLEPLSPRLNTPQGVGFGLNSLLQKVDWKTLDDDLKSD